MLAGDLRIYSAPKALLRHIQWSLNEIFGYPVELNWEAQHLAPGALATQLQWRELKPVASKIASTLKSWHYLRFEVQEFCSEGAELFRFTPELGMHRAFTDGTGSILISENVIRKSLATFDDLEIRENLGLALGSQWDQALEPYRGVDLQEVQRLRAI